MFTYTCPKCGARQGCENLPNGAVRQCIKCPQRMRVVHAEDSAKTSTVARGKGYGPLLLGVSALTGIFIGGGIFLASYRSEVKPAPSSPIGELARTNVPGTPESAPDRKTSTGQKSDTSPNADTPGKSNTSSKPEEKTDREIRTEDRSKLGTNPKPEPTARSSDDLYNEMLKSCVWILATDGKNTWSGSGSLIDRDERLVLTNQHVANRRCKKIWVFFPMHRDGKLVTESETYLANLEQNSFPASFVCDQAICDLALIRLSRLPAGVRALRLSKRKVRPGQQLHTVGGKPKGNTAVWIYSSGPVRQVSTKQWTYGDGFNREAEVIASAVSTNSGDSGGAVVDDRGFLVGVHAMSSDGVLNAGHIHVDEVRRFLQSAYSKELDKQFKELPDEQAVGPVLAEKIDKHIKGLDAPLAEDRMQAANELGKIGPDAKKAVMRLLKIVRTPTEISTVRQAAADALKEIGAPSEEYFKQLLSALEDKNCKDARRYAALSLGSLSEDKRKEAVEALKNALKDNDTQVRQNAANALRSYHKFAYEEANLELVECLRDNEVGVRNAAYEALRAGGIPDEVDLSSVKDLLEGVKDGKKPTREARYWAALLLVGKFKEKGLPFVAAALEEEENFEDAAFVIYVVKQLAEYKINSLEVGTILSKALDHRDVDVQNMAIDTFLALKGEKYRDILSIDENTVEALLKLFLKLPKLLEALDKREKAANQDKKDSKSGTEKKDPRKDFEDTTKILCTTFNNRVERVFNSSPKLVDILRNALSEPDALARRVAVNCLERTGKDAAKTAPALVDALRKEKEADVRIEILAALAALGETGKAELDSSKETQLREELDKWIGDARGDNNEVQILASLAMASYYPGKQESSKAYRVLARALLLTNAPISIDVIQLARFLRRKIEPWKRQEPNEHEKELHERAKQALSRGGVLAGEAVYGVFETSFLSLGSEKVDTTIDKIHARISALQVLAKIGSPLMNSKISGKLNKLIRWELVIHKQGLEESRVAEAAREAMREIFGK